MTSHIYFSIIGKGDIPIFEINLNSSAENSRDKNQMIPFILHASLDHIDQRLNTTSALYLKSVDKFGDHVISAYATAGYAKFILSHPQKMDESIIKVFFADAHELYVKAIMNPFSEVHLSLNSAHFEDKIRDAARKGLVRTS